MKKYPPGGLVGNLCQCYHVNILNALGLSSSTGVCGKQAHPRVVYIACGVMAVFTLETVATEWQEAVRPGDRWERMEQAQRWNDYYSYLARQQSKMAYKQDSKTEHLIRYMLREDILRTSDRVLDIGSGIGGYSLALAKHCEQVTALDANEDCLSVLKHRAEQAGIKGIRCVPLFWEQLDTETRHKKYDLCFSAMCPAICNVQELERMEALSRRAACLVAVARGSYEKHRREMMRLLGIKPSGMTTEALFYYNVLYMMGRQPSVKCWADRFEYSMSAEEVLDRYPRYFKIFGIEESHSVSFLESYLDANAIDGVLLEECQMNMAMIYWRVPNLEKG